LKKAITAAFRKVNIGLTAEDAENYFTANVKAKFYLNPLSEVMNQKYIAFFEEEAIEAYNDYRRLKAMGNDVISLKNPLNSNRFPLRFSYGSEDVTTNKNIRDAYVMVSLFLSRQLLRRRGVMELSHIQAVAYTAHATVILP